MPTVTPATDDTTADGLTHGMWLLLNDILRGTPFAERLVSAAPLLAKAYILDVKSQWAGVDQIVRRVHQLKPKMSNLEKLALQLFEADLQGQPMNRLAISWPRRSRVRSRAASAATTTCSPRSSNPPE